jgi:GT2 family glycosyltransferase
MQKASIAAVILTMHRLDQLKIAIDSLRNQTRKIDEIIVVLQGDNSDLLSWLKQQPDIVLHHQENKGSAGGFAKGMEIAIQRNHDWVWITDDDAFPELNTLETLTSCQYFNDITTGFLSPIIVDINKNVYMSPVPKDQNLWYKTVLSDKCIPIKSAAWPGCLVSSKSIINLGLPIAEYFFYDEDIEFTQRVASKLNSYCVIDAVFNHHQAPSANLWKSKKRYPYYVRNRIATIRLTDESHSKKLLGQFKWSAEILLGIIKGKIPPAAVISLINGLLFFKPKILFPSKF